MVARLKPESVSSRTLRPQTRRVARQLAQARIAIRSNHGDSGDATLRDVSVFGCALDSNANWLRSGMFIALILSESWSIQALVRWVRDGRAGVEFLRSISTDQANEISNEPA